MVATNIETLSSVCGAVVSHWCQVRLQPVTLGLSAPPPKWLETATTISDQALGEIEAVAYGSVDVLKPEVRFVTEIAIPKASG